MLNWHRRMPAITLGLMLLGTIHIRGVLAQSVVLVSPSADDWALLAYAMAGVAVPAHELALADRTVAAKDEFNRRAAATSMEERIRARFDTIKDMRQITLNLNSKFGDYNDIYSEFDFDINDGTYITFYTSTNQRQLVVNLVNGGMAQAWQVLPPMGARIIQTTGGDRDVVLGMKLQIVGASVPADVSQPIRVDARILEYDITGAHKPIRLGHVVVK